MFSVNKGNLQATKRVHTIHVDIFKYIILGPVVQSVVSLTSSLVVKMLTVLVNTSNSQVFLLKNVSSVCKSQATHIFFSTKY